MKIIFGVVLSALPVLSYADSQASIGKAPTVCLNESQRAAIAVVPATEISTIDPKDIAAQVVIQAIPADQIQQILKQETELVVDTGIPSELDSLLSSLSPPQALQTLKLLPSMINNVNFQASFGNDPTLLQSMLVDAQDAQIDVLRSQLNADQEFKVVFGEAVNPQQASALVNGLAGSHSQQILSALPTDQAQGLFHSLTTAQLQILFPGKDLQKAIDQVLSPMLANPTTLSDQQWHTMILNLAIPDRVALLRQIPTAVPTTVPSSVTKAPPTGITDQDLLNAATSISADQLAILEAKLKIDAKLYSEFVLNKQSTAQVLAIEGQPSGAQVLGVLNGLANQQAQALLQSLSTEEAQAILQTIPTDSLKAWSAGLGIQTLSSFFRQVNLKQASDLKDALNDTAWRTVFATPTPFQAQRIMSMLDHAAMMALVNGIASDPKSSLQFVQLLTPAQAYQLVADTTTLPPKKDASAADTLKQLQQSQGPSSSTMGKLVVNLSQNVSPPAGSIEPEQATIVNGLAQFVEVRTRAEAEDLVVNYVLAKLCDPKTPNVAAMFPKTCAVQADQEANASVIQADYLTLVSALRQDLDLVPACVYYRDSGSPLVYQLESIYEQNSDGESLDLLLDGLANSGQLNPVPPNGDLSAVPCQYKTLGGFKDTHKQCVVVMTVLMYVAALEAQQYMNSDKNTNWTSLDRLIQVHAFSASLSRLANTNNLPEFSSAVTKWAAGNFNTVQMNAISARLVQFGSLRSELTSIAKKLNEPTVQKTLDDMSDELLSIGNITRDQIYTVLQIGFIDNSSERFLDNEMYFITDLQSGYNAMQSRQYSIALQRIEPILREIAGANSADDQTSVCNLGTVEDKSCQNVGTDLTAILTVAADAAALADAKNSNDFASTLDQIASPVDEWKFRHKDDMWTLSAYGGIALQDAIYDIPKYGTLRDYSYAVFAPIGVSRTFSGCACGFLVSLLDVGNIIQQPKTINFAKGQLAGGVQSALANVFTPGLYGVWSISADLPLTLIVGWSHGPSDFRNVNYNDGTTGLASRGTMFSVSIAFDIIMFRFR